MITVDNVASLTSLTGISDQQFVTLLGNTTALDGGGQELRYNATGRSGVTIDNRRYYTAGGTDDYFKTATEVYDVPYLRSLPADAKETVRMDEGVHTIDADLTLGDGVVLEVPNGAMFSVDSGMTLTINGQVDAGDYQIFDGAGDVLIRYSEVPTPYIDSATDDTCVSPYQLELQALWFAGDDIGEKVNGAIAAGGDRVVIKIPSGFWTLTTTIDMHWDNSGQIVLEGSGYIGTTLRMPAGTPMVGIDMQFARECEIRNLRVTETGSGTLGSVCVAIGGTTSKIRNCWVGNAMIGVYMQNGGEQVIDNTVIEHCTYGVFIGAYHSISSLGLTNGSNCRVTKIRDSAIYSCQVAAVNIGNYNQLVVSSVTGAFAIGDEIECDQTGETRTVLDWDAANSQICIDRTYPTFITGNTITNNTQSGTASITGHTTSFGRGHAIYDTELYGDDGDTTGVGVILRADRGSTIDAMIDNNAEEGIDSIDSTALRVTGVVARNGRGSGTGIKLRGGDAVIHGLSAGNNGVGSNQIVDIDTQDCELRLDDSSCALTSATPIVGTFDRSPSYAPQYVSGAGTPVGSVTPNEIGQEYFDTGGTWYKSTGLTNTDWVALN